MGHAITWTEDEDVILANSWLLISHDPIKSNQQTGETFWERIFAVFSSKLVKKYGEQAASSCTVTTVQNRWSTMNHILNKFVGVLSQIKAEIRAAKAAVKMEKKDGNTQLELDRQIAAAQRGKAKAAPTQARTLRDEFLLKLIAFNPDTAEVKEWVPEDCGGFNRSQRNEVEEGEGARRKGRRDGLLEESRTELVLLETQKRRRRRSWWFGRTGAYSCFYQQ